MEVIHLSYPHQRKKEEFPETVCAIGFFDGIHRGHQAIIKKAIQFAQIEGRKSSVLTFFPHPRVILSKGKETIQYITPPREKEMILQALGVDYLYVVHFDEGFSQLIPEQFIDNFIKRLNIRHLIAGFDFSFGY